MFQAVLKNNPKQIKNHWPVCMYMYGARAIFKNSQKSNSKNI